MSEDTGRATRPAGREMSVLAFGDNVGEVEMAALDEVRAFFGEDLRLEIVPSYQVWDVRPTNALAAEANGKKYYARIVVRVIEP